MRQSAVEIFHAALAAVDAREITRRAISVEHDVIKIVDGVIDLQKPVYALAIGKAAGPMAQAIDEILGKHVAQGVITCPEGSANQLSSKWQRFHGGHPFPNADSLAAGNASFKMLQQANTEKATVIFAISGGGSAMLEWPVRSDISLSDLQQTNRVLVTCAATIAEVNTVRRAFSAVKGGKLASLAPNANLITLIISDTNRGDEANVASGPTLSISTQSNAAEIVKQFDLESKLPATILRAISESPESFVPKTENARHYVLADNRTAIEAAAAHALRIGFLPVVDESISEQPIAEGCRDLVEQVKALRAPVCLISGGEFSCPVVGDGVGGRNSETALRCAIALDGDEHDTVMLSLGTDGIDGNSPAAGAIADTTTLSRARAVDMNAEEFLARSDSYSFFAELGDAIITGPTGTNVRDLRMILKT